MKNAARINLLIAIISKSLAFILAIYAAKVLSVKDFAFYIYFLLIYSYLPIFQCGTLSGMIYTLPQKLSTNRLEGIRFYYNTHLFSMLLHTIAAASIFCVDIGINLQYKLILYFSLILDKLIENEIVLQSSLLNFYNTNWLKIFRDIGTPLCRIIALVAFQSLAPLLVAFFIPNILTTILAFAINPQIPRFFSGIKKHISNLYLIGFPLFIIWALEFLLRSIDRYFIAQFYPKEILASYGFAANMAQTIILLVTSYLSPYFQTMLIYSAQNKTLMVKNLLSQVSKKLTLGLLVSIILASIVYPVGTTLIVKKYNDSFLIFLILLVGNILLSICLLQAQYLLSVGQKTFLIKLQGFLLGCMLIIYLFFSLLKTPPLAFAITMSVAELIYFLFVIKKTKEYFQKTLNI